MSRLAFFILALSLFISTSICEVFEGYTLFTESLETSSIITGYSTKLIDNNYNIINEWLSTQSPASMAYLLPDSTLIYPCRQESLILESSAIGGRIIKYNWDGDILWDWSCTEDYQLHHDIQPIENGNILAIAMEKISEDVLSDVILEIRPSGFNSAEIVWEWHVWDHLGSNNPYKFDQDVPYDKIDWNHFNSIHLNNDGDKIYLSSRKWSEFYIIAYRGDSDILYRWGNPQNYGIGGDENKILDANHSVNEINIGYPGEGNVLIFNNNASNQSINNSEVIELKIPLNYDNNYYLDEYGKFGPDDYVWQYQNDFFSPFQSGVFRLSNGNTLITEADASRIFEITLDGNLVWQFNNPESMAINRAQKYDILYFNTLGDINNDELINILDIVLLSRFILGLDIPSVMEFKTSDYNDDEVLDILDVVSIVSTILNI